jgi:hypothetical protein
MSDRYPDFARPLWSLTLAVSSLVLAPCAVFSGDLLARHWTDILWTTSPVVKKLEGNQVKYIYYALVVVYAAWGTLAFLPRSRWPGFHRFTPSGRAIRDRHLEDSEPVSVF